MQTLRTAASSVCRAVSAESLQSHAVSKLTRRWRGDAVSRDPRFASVQDADLAFFRGVLGPTGVITDPTTLEGYNRDWMRKYEGHSRVALRPTTTEQVSKVLAHCNARRLAVVPQGGNTGLVGGSVPVFDEVVLSLSAMNKIVEIDPVASTATCQAGVVLEALDAALAERGLAVPLDLGAKGSCQLGGNVSTNAGGLRLLRYGSLRGTVLGLEVVRADGSVLDLLRTLRKDNTGYDLRQLFIGAEGTLGVVTQVALLAAPRPASVQVCFLAVRSFEAVQEVMVRSKRQLGEILSAVEFLDRASLDLVLANLEGTRDPLPGASGVAAGSSGGGGGGGGGGGAAGPFYMVVETSGSNEAHDREKLDAFLSGVVSDGLALDGTVAESTAQARELWGLRERITEALVRAGAVYKYDVSLPTHRMYELVRDMRERLRGTGAVTVGYGHVGDGNLHLNVSTTRPDERVLGLIEPFIYEWTAAARGSVSAEHGIGAMKPGAMHYSKPEGAIQLMRELKGLFDPNGILNPYKVIPPQNTA